MWARSSAQCRIDFALPCPSCIVCWSSAPNLGPGPLIGCRVRVRFLQPSSGSPLVLAATAEAPVAADASRRRLVAVAAGAPSARGRPSMPRSYRRLVLCALGALCVVGPTALGVVAAPAPALRPRKIDQAPRTVGLDDRLRFQRRQEVASSAQSSTTASIDGSLSASSAASSAALEPEPTAAGPSQALCSSSPPQCPAHRPRESHRPTLHRRQLAPAALPLVRFGTCGAC